MNEPRVTKAQAIKLKAAGFDWKTQSAYHKRSNQEYSSDTIFPDFPIMDFVYPSPTLSDVTRWLREVKGWHVIARPDRVIPSKWYFSIFQLSGQDWIRCEDFDLFTTHDLALSAGIDEGLSRLEKDASN